MYIGVLEMRLNLYFSFEMMFNLKLVKQGNGKKYVSYLVGKNNENIWTKVKFCLNNMNNKLQQR